MAQIKDVKETVLVEAEKTFTYLKLSSEEVNWLWAVLSRVFVASPEPNNILNAIRESSNGSFSKAVQLSKTIEGTITKTK